MNTQKNPIWAKSIEKGEGKPITLHEHTNNVLHAFESLRARINNTLHDVIKIAIVCHDFGKVLPSFQIKTLGNRVYSPFDVNHDVPHSIFSALWVNQENLEEQIKQQNPNDVEEYKRFILSAIAYHHWRERFIELLRAGNNELQSLCEKIEDSNFLELLTTNLKSETSQIPYNCETLISFNTKMAEGIKNGVSFADYVHPPYQLYWIPQRIGMNDRKSIDWILISGFLMRCDHFASYCEEEGLEICNVDIQSVAYNEVKEKVKDKIGSRDEQKIWQINKVDSSKNKNIILVAPTGYGKTEFAFLWSNGEKFFYTLPLRSAVNQIFKRALDIFENNNQSEKVGLLHSDADVYLLGDGGEKENLKLYDLARQLSFPVIVSTGDQFFPYALRPPGYEKIYATFSYSRLVIDEVQAYDPKAAAIIVKFIEDITRMGGKFLLMTATLPEFVRTKINEAIKRAGSNAEVINIYADKEREFKNIQKHKIQFRLISNSTQNEKPDLSLPDEQIRDILERAGKSKRVLVILNTVKQAQDVYRRLKVLIEQDSQFTHLNQYIWLLHSRFSFNDRADIEKRICGDKDKNTIDEFQNPKLENENIGKILVATQVVEASLDIDADVLFTEIAPMDAIVQRLGRILRRIRLNEDGEVIDTSKKIENQSATEKYQQSDENVFVWIFEKGLESGNGKVYKKELLGITLKLLCLNDEEKAKTSDEIKKDVQNWYQDKKWEDFSVINKNNERIDLKEESKPKSKAAKNKKGKKQNNKKHFEIILPSNPFLFSEFEKYERVKQLYDALDENGDYLDKFYKTLEILNAGYMSDRKEEAQKMFREIYSVTVIPNSMKNDLKQEMDSFVESIEKRKNLYTHFKKEVLSKYVVSIPMNSKLLSEIKRLELWIMEQPKLDKYQKQFIRWCNGIYFVDCEYDGKQGLRIKNEKKFDDSVFL